MKMIAGAASLACWNRSRTREAPTPTIISTNSDADIWKNGTPASPATARASSVLPVPGWPLSSTPRGMPAAELEVLVGVLEEVDDLRQLGLGLVDAGHVVERDVLVGALDPAGARAAERHQPAGAAAARRGAAEDPHEQQQEQQRRTEAEHQAGQERRPGVRRVGVDRDVVLLEQCEQLLRCWRTTGSGSRSRCSALAVRGVLDRLLERPLDRCAGRGDRADVVGLASVRNVGLYGIRTRGFGLSTCEETQKFSAISATMNSTASQRMFGRPTAAWRADRRDRPAPASPASPAAADWLLLAARPQSRGALAPAGLLGHLLIVARVAEFR